MRTHESLLLRPAQGWLVASVMAFLVVLMSAGADDVFARHVGMSVSASPTSGTAADADSLAVPSDTRSATGDVLPARPDHSSGDRDGAAHVLHLLGACLAILCAGAALVHRRGWWPSSTRATAAASTRLVAPASWLAGVRRSPPPLSPPRSSPVIRT